MPTPLGWSNNLMKLVLLTCLVCFGLTAAGQAPESARVRIETTQGVILIELTRAWAPQGVDRFYQLVKAGYYDGNFFFRVVENRWAQFGINGDPAISAKWHQSNIADDPQGQPNTRGTVAFAFAVPNGRTTQVFINLTDNSATLDKEPFVPIGKVVKGMDVADRLYSGYGESSGGGIRAARQEPLFIQGNAYLESHYPKLDRIIRATVQP